jgi:hypothetical protein
MLSMLTVCFATALVPAPALDRSSPPLEIAFERFCGLAEGRDEVFDSRTDVLHIHFHEGNTFDRISQASVFEIKKVNGRLPRSLAFRLTGIPSHKDQPLRMFVGEQNYILEPKHFDKSLFRVERRGDATRIEFTEKGLALLQPGARFEFVEMSW